jgi:hypothetical protein
MLDMNCDQSVEAALVALSPGDVEPIHDALNRAAKASDLEKMRRAARR